MINNNQDPLRDLINSSTLDQPPSTLTESILARVNTGKQSLLSGYQPVISNTMWWIIGIIISALTAATIYLSGNSQVSDTGMFKIKALYNPEITNTINNAFSSSLLVMATLIVASIASVVIFNFVANQKLLKGS